MDNCIFCKIVINDIPSYQIYEDEHYLGFLDIHPKTPGHCLLIPKKHFRRVYDVDNMGQYFATSKIIIDKLITKLNADSVIILAVGEEVAHAHIQLIPQYSDSSKLSGFSLEQIVAKINS
jgi:histidine triad (HIT) family protein